MVFAAHVSQASMCRSVPQIPVALTSTRTSAGFTVGVGSSTSSNPGPGSHLTRAFTRSASHTQVPDPPPAETYVSVGCGRAWLDTGNRVPQRARAPQHGEAPVNGELTGASIAVALGRSPPRWRTTVLYPGLIRLQGAQAVFSSVTGVSSGFNGVSIMERRRNARPRWLRPRRLGVQSPSPAGCEPAGLRCLDSPPRDTGPVTVSVFDLVQHRHGPVQLPHRRPDARGGAIRPGAGRDRDSPAHDSRAGGACPALWGPPATVMAATTPCSGASRARTQNRSTRRPGSPALRDQTHRSASGSTEPTRSPSTPRP